MLSVWPSEYRPGCGQTHRPWGPDPTGMRARSCPVLVEMAYTSLLYRPLSQSTLPSAETPPMSGLPPPGIRHVSTTFRVSKLSTETEPALRFETYRSLPSRLGYRPWAPAPVLMRPVTLNRLPSTFQTPPAARSAT